MIGGFIGRLIQKPEPDAKFHPAGFLVGARAIVMLSLALVVSRTATVHRLGLAVLELRRLQERLPDVLHEGTMRHTFATWALEGNEEKGIAPAPILAVRDWMGHASVQETEGYLHRSTASHSKAVANLDAYVTT